MEDVATGSRSHRGRECLIAATQNILAALRSNHSIGDDVGNLLLELGTHLSPVIEMKVQLEDARDKIMKSMSPEAGPDITDEFLKATREIQKLVEHLGTFSQSGDANEKKLFCEADNILQIAMDMLKEAAVNTLSHLSQGDTFVFPEDELSQGASSSMSFRTELYPHAAPLFPLDSITELKSIANLMFEAKYDPEFCEVFIESRQEALEECLISLEMDRFSIEDLMKMDWSYLEFYINRWTEALKSFVQVHLVAEKWLCGQIFADLGAIHLTIFANASKPSMLFLLNFGEAIALGPLRPERLISLLRVCEALSGLLQDIDALFSEDAGSWVRGGCRELVSGFGAAARRTFLEFGDKVLSDPSKDPVPGGGLASITRYVMNFIKTLVLYHETLCVLLQDQGAETVNQASSHPIVDSLVARHLQSITTNLEHNLEQKSRLYKDGSLRHIFLMSNIHYIVQKVRDTELMQFFGEEWTKARIKCYRQHFSCYQRAVWGPVVDCLRVEVSSNSKTRMKEYLERKLRGFYRAFDEACKSQRGWYIRDAQLKSELRASICHQVVLAYQGFVHSCIRYDLERHIVYEAEDLERFLGELFEGSPSSRPSAGYFRRRD